jgi:hypothetical protein
MSGGQDEVWVEHKDAIDLLVAEVREQAKRKKAETTACQYELVGMTTERNRYRTAAELWEGRFNAVSESQIGAWNRGFLYGMVFGAFLAVVLSIFGYVIAV